MAAKMARDKTDETVCVMSVTSQLWVLIEKYSKII